MDLSLLMVPAEACLVGFNARDQDSKGNDKRTRG